MHGDHWCVPILFLVITPFFSTWISTLNNIQDWPSHVDISNRVTRRDVLRILCRYRNVAKMSSECNFLNYCYKHNEFRISLQAKAPSETSLKCVILFFLGFAWRSYHLGSICVVLRSANAHCLWPPSVTLVLHCHTVSGQVSDLQSATAPLPHRVFLLPALGRKLLALASKD